MVNLQDGFVLSSLIKNLIENFATEEMAVEIDTFFKTSNLDWCDYQTIQCGIQNIKFRYAWLKRDSNDLALFLINETTNFIIVE